MIGLDLKKARIISVAAATAISLACGSNYVYSAWGPQFAHRLKLNSTQSNLIGTMGNLGMYACGIPFGMLVDSRGPRWGVAIGTILLAGGYYPIAKAYEAGPGSYSLPVLCLFSLLTGAGSASAFMGAIKTSALNYPESRGTATAFPLAAFGLSAFFFSTISVFAMPDDTYKFLLLLATGTFILPVVSFFFLRVLPPNTYHQLPQHERLHRTNHSPSPPSRPGHEPGAPNDLPKGANAPPATKDDEDEDIPADNGEEASSLLSKSSGPGLESSKRVEPDESHHLDIRGFALLPLPEFWQLFSMLGLLTGIGLMTINNIGNDVRALWLNASSTDNPPSDAFIQKRQSMHVSLLSFASFTGRLLSGIGSDLLVSRLNRSRFWCLFASATIFTCTQLLAVRISSPDLLFLVSGFTGLAYGILFGVYPSLTAHAFGVHGLSQNWGTMTLAPVIAGNIFNLLYGRIYDGNSDTDEQGDMICRSGVSCYAVAYWITFAAAIGGVGLVVWSIWHENRVHQSKDRGGGGGKKGKSRARHEREA